MKLRIKMYKTLYFFLFLIAFLLFGHLYYFFTGDFQEAHILKRSDIEKSLFLKDQSEQETEKILQQNFYYLDAGHQTYAFLSEDKKYVLKLFKKDYLTRSPLVNILPPVYPFRTLFLHRGISKETRINKLIRGYSLAITLDMENSGLLFLNLSPENPSFQKVQLFNGLGRKLDIDINPLIFALQKKAVPTKKVLSDLLSKGDIENAKLLINKLIDLYISQYQKGIFDHDHNFLDNTGFVDDTPIRVDVGKIELKPDIKEKSVYMKDLRKLIDKRLLPWIQKNYPQYYEDIKDTFLEAHHLHYLSFSFH